MDNSNSSSIQIKPDQIKFMEIADTSKLIPPKVSPMDVSDDFLDYEFPKEFKSAAEFLSVEHHLVFFLCVAVSDDSEETSTEEEDDIPFLYRFPACITAQELLNFAAENLYADVDSIDQIIGPFGTNPNKGEAKLYKNDDTFEYDIPSDIGLKPFKIYFKFKE